MYVKLGSRLVRIGNMSVIYDMAGSRVRHIGDLTIDYDRMGTRARHLTAKDAAQPTQ